MDYNVKVIPLSYYDTTEEFVQEVKTRKYLKLNKLNSQ